MARSSERKARPVPEDIYDLLTVLLQHAARSGLGEAIVHAGEGVIEKFDPKIKEKRAAAEAQAAQDAKDYAEFEAFKRFRDGKAAAPAADVPAPPVPVQAGPPVVNG